MVEGILLPVPSCKGSLELFALREIVKNILEIYIYRGFCPTEIVRDIYMFMAMGPGPTEVVGEKLGQLPWRRSH